MPVLLQRLFLQKKKKKRAHETPHSRSCEGGEMEKNFSLWVLGFGMQKQWEQKWLEIRISFLKEMPMIWNKAYSKTEQNAYILPSNKSLTGFDYCNNIEEKSCFGISVLVPWNFQNSIKLACVIDNVHKV